MPNGPKLESFWNLFSMLLSYRREKQDSLFDRTYNMYPFFFSSMIISMFNGRGGVAVVDNSQECNSWVCVSNDLRWGTFI